MSKMYPNGGYRSMSARELSTPAQATPPIVTGNTVRVSGNNALARPAYQPLGDPGVVTSKGGSGGAVIIDLRDWAAKNGRQFGPSSNYGGNVRVKFDIKPSHYRNDPRAAVGKAALGAARQLVRGMARLPKNAYAELVSLIADQMLAQLQNMIFPGVKSGVRIGIVPGSVTGGGVWNIRDGVSYSAQDTIDIPLVDLAQANIRQSGGPPAVGEIISGGFSILPSASTSQINAWLAAGRVPYLTSRNEVANEASALQNNGPLSHIYRNIVIGEDLPGVFNSRLLATLRIPRGAGRVAIEPYTDVRPLTLGATFPIGSVTGSSTDPNPYPKVKRRWKTNDRKYGMPPLLYGVAAVAWGATEFGDLIDSIYGNLPKHRQWGRSYLDKLTRIHSYWREIDWGGALGDIVMNHYEDKVVGRAMDRISKQLRKTDIGGTNYKYGVTSGGGSTIYTGNITL